MFIFTISSINLNSPQNDWNFDLTLAGQGDTVRAIIAGNKNEIKEIKIDKNIENGINCWNYE